MTSCLTKVKTTKDLTQVCFEMIADSQHVSLDLEKLSEFSRMFDSTTKPIGWGWYTRSQTQGEMDTFFDLVFNAGLNGGYFYEENGKVKQWAKDGSGASATVAWISSLWEDQVLPGINLQEDEIIDMIGPRLSGIPYASWRLDTCREFADKRRFAKLVGGIFLKSQNSDWSYTFDLARVDDLVELYPTAFGGDPFRKKAVLAFMMMAGYLTTHGHIVYYDLPIPSDYQMPRIFSYKGAIRLSKEFENKIRGDRLLDVRSEEVTHYRAAAIVASSKLAKWFNVSTMEVDNVLFGTFRKDPDFKENSLPPMKCDTTWF